MEEEFLLVDPVTRRLVPWAREVLEATDARDVGPRVEHELQLCQVETATDVCRTLDEVRAAVNHLRQQVSAAAERAGCRIASAGTHPLPVDEGSRVTPKPAYHQLAEHYQLVMREQVVCGCHVHVGLADREAVIQVMNRSRPWLHVLLALAANSPFWNGQDTGYASFRTEVWQRWPLAGPPHVFASRADYDELVEALRATRSIDEPARIYWDIRPSARFDTVEFRVADACLSVDETVMVAGLVRALVATAYREHQDGKRLSAPRPELVRAAAWRAARYGLDGELVDLHARRSAPAAELVTQLLEFVRPALEFAGEWEQVAGLVNRVQRHGTGATRQRSVAVRSGGRLEDVVDFVVAQTAGAAA